MVHWRSCRVAGESDATQPLAPAQWLAAVRHLVAILPARASYGFGSKDEGRDGWRPLQAESASEGLPVENNDAPMRRVLGTALPFRARKSHSFQARAAIPFSTARIELRRAGARSSGYDQINRSDSIHPARCRSFRF